ncbi:MAG TPA: FtsX-like permease family protein, partial [Candidatus Thermoplasmatota archaeon]|nr:FtsX-like permease family protein [Candidatus Thermoplasmatota archaeon]
LEVSSKAAANEPFQATVIVLYETYDLNELLNFTRQYGSFGEQLRDGFGGGGDGGDGGGFGDIRLHTANLTVRGILTTEGKGDFLLQPGIFLRLPTAQALYEREGRINLVGVSNTGHPETGVARSPEVKALFTQGLAAVAAEDPDEPSYKALKIQETKQQFLDRAALAGERFTQFLTVISTFTVIAGVMLIVNIFVMLAEERKSELGMARAVGLKRRQLLLLFSFEGLLYALLAAFIGVLLGLGIAWGLLYVFNNILSSIGDNGPRITQFPFHPEMASLTLAFAAGFFITLITVAVASNKVSKLNVVRAIRRIEEPEKTGSLRVPLFGAALTLLSGFATAAGFLYDVYALKVYAPAVGLLGLGAFLSRWVPRRLVYPVTGALVAAFVGWTLFGIAQAEDTTSQVLGILRGVVLVLAVVLIVIYVPQLPLLLKRLLTRLKPFRAIAAPAVAYPLEKKTRTGLTVSMFALVILVVVVFSTLGSTFQVDLKKMSGGFDVSADSTTPISDLEAFYANNVTDKPERNPFESVERYEALVRARAQGEEVIKINGQPVPGARFGATFYSYGPGFPASSQYEFRELDPRYATPQAALEAVRSDSSLVILSTDYDSDEAGNPGLYHPGDTLTLSTVNGNVSFTIIGIMKNQFLGGIWVHEDVISGNFQRVRGEYLFKLKPGSDAVQVAKDLEAAFEVAGMDAVSIEEEAKRIQEITNRFLTLFQLFLAFGLVVGIASMGIITARNVIERRQEIGMLRAVGFPRRAVLSLFMSEVLFTTLMGIAIGVVVGVFIAYAVFATSLQDLDVEFAIPWLDITVILVLTAAVTILATFWPARKASLVPPAEAVRYIE